MIRFSLRTGTGLGGHFGWYFRLVRQTGSSVHRTGAAHHTGTGVDSSIQASWTDTAQRQGLADSSAHRQERVTGRKAGQVL
jgi:hypothetical protein